MQRNRSYGRGKEMEKQLLGELLHPLVEKFEVGVLEFDHYVNIHIRFVIFINTKFILCDRIYHSCAAPTC